MYYRIINTLDHHPYWTWYNDKSLKELSQSLLWLTCDLDSYDFDKPIHSFNWIYNELKSWNDYLLGLYKIEKRKYPFKYDDLKYYYTGDTIEIKGLDKQLWNRFKRK